MKLLDVFSDSHLLVDLKARDKKGAIKEIVQHLIEAGTVDEETGKKIEKAVHKRETSGSTGIGKGLAIPHAKGCSFVDSFVGALARSTEGIEYNSIDGGLVHVLFLVVSPEAGADEHMVIMRKIAALHRDERNIRFFRTTTSVESVKEILQEIDEAFP